ncbi:MAG: NUDIX domain-containing protein [Candidatus Latescibacteria bacterium]|nr:NUDIX domain-containing protein [Candidatus Latescibacterota bacterium]
MSRAQCIVVRQSKVLMVRHQHSHDQWWCLPGGGIEKGESPQQAALRELAEECRVTGRVVAAVSQFAQNGQRHYTYHVDIGDQQPQLGYDPEHDNQILVGVDWLGLEQLAERDRVYLWTAGLLAVPGFLQEIERWPRPPAYPLKSKSGR